LVNRKRDQTEKPVGWKKQNSLQLSGRKVPRGKKEICKEKTMACWRYIGGGETSQTEPTGSRLGKKTINSTRALKREQSKRGGGVEKKVTAK